MMYHATQNFIEGRACRVSCWCSSICQRPLIWAQPGKWSCQLQSQPFRGGFEPPWALGFHENDPEFARSEIRRVAFVVQDQLWWKWWNSDHLQYLELSGICSHVFMDFLFYNTHMSTKNGPPWLQFQPAQQEALRSELPRPGTQEVWMGYHHHHHHHPHGWW